MSFKMKRHRNNTEEEKNILINSIISSDFLSEISRVMKKEYLLSDASRILWNWIFEYWNEFGESPKKQIKDIYTINKEKIDDNESKMIHELLTGLNEKHIEDSKNFNYKYHVKNAIKYIKRRALEEHHTNVKALLSLGKIEEAESLEVNYNRIMKETSQWINPFDEEFIKRIRTKKDEDILFTFPGRLGQLVGPLKRGWCVCLLGKFSFGKTWMLREISNLALFNRLSVSEFSLEMDEYSVTDRFYRRILSCGEKSGEYIIPTFDCYYNMAGTCTKKNRKCKERLFDPKHEQKPIPDIQSFLPEYSSTIDLGPIGYKCCSYCREKHPEDYRAEVWYERINRNEICESDIIKKTRAIKRMYSDGLRIMCYPKFSSNVQNIRSDLEVLEYTEKFVPDVVVVDYPGILAVEDNRVTNQEQHLNDTWVALCQLASEKGILVVGAAQAKADSIRKKSLVMGDNAQSVRAISANCDVILGIFGTEEEKKLGIARMNVIKHRHREFNEQDEITILRQLELGQTLLDSEFIDERG